MAVPGNTTTTKVVQVKVNGPVNGGAANYRSTTPFVLVPVVIKVALECLYSTVVILKVAGPPFPSFLQSRSFSSTEPSLVGSKP